MKTCPTSVITKRWLAVVLILGLLPCLAMAKHSATLDQQLIEAARSGDVATVKSLLDKGADLNAKDNKSRTVLMNATKGGHLEVARLLVDKGADLTAKLDGGITALGVAVTFGHLDLARLLIEKDADVNAKGEKGATVLMFAMVGGGDHEILKLLLDKG